MSEEWQNPLIASDSGSTLEHCDQVLSVLSLATEAQSDSDPDTEGMGTYLILEAVRNALRYELTARKVAKLEGKA